MPTREQGLAALDGGTDHTAAAARRGIHSGLAYFIATRMPADGSDVPTPEELRPRAQGDRPMLAATRARTVAMSRGTPPGSPRRRP